MHVAPLGEFISSRKYALHDVRGRTVGAQRHGSHLSSPAEIEVAVRIEEGDYLAHEGVTAGRCRMRRHKVGLDQDRVGIVLSFDIGCVAKAVVVRNRCRVDQRIGASADVPLGVGVLSQDLALMKSYLVSIAQHVRLLDIA